MIALSQSKSAPYGSFKFLIILSLLPAFVMAQTSKQTHHITKDPAHINAMVFKRAPGGMLYHNYTNNPSPKIKEGDFVSVNVIAKTEADSILLSTYKQGSPLYQIIIQREEVTL